MSSYIGNLHQLMEDVCNNKLTKKQEERLLHFLHAMNRCLGDQCSTVTIHTKNNNICEMANELKRFVPLSTRNLESKYNVTMEDLRRFDRLDDEEDIYQLMQDLYGQLHVDKKNEIHSFKELLALLFALQTTVNIEVSKEQPKKTESSIMSIIDVLENKELKQDWRPSAYALWLWKQASAEEALTILEETLPAEPKFRPLLLVKPDENMGLIQLQDLISEYNQVHAEKTISSSFWSRLELALEHIFTNRILSQSYIKVRNDLEYNRYMICIPKMYRYRNGSATLRAMKPSFSHLDDDIISLQTIVNKLDARPYLHKWNNLKKGIVSRVWSQTRDDDHAVKILLSFFPLPYRAGAKWILPLLLSSSECKKWNAQNPSMETDNMTASYSKCGCNCFCSTMMGMMLSNEIGLLGTRIHALLAPRHIYLAIGNRFRDWSEYKLKVLETTDRSSRPEGTCRQSFQELIALNPNSYSIADILIPNIHEYYLIHTSGILEIAYEKAMNRYLSDFIQIRSTNIYGVNELLTRMDFKRPDRKSFLHKFMRLIEFEYRSSTLHEFGSEHAESTLELPYVAKPWFALVFDSVLSETPFIESTGSVFKNPSIFEITINAHTSNILFHQVKTIIKRIGKHSRFGKSDPVYWMQKHNFNMLAEMHNPKFIFKH